MTKPAWYFGIMAARYRHTGVPMGADEITVPNVSAFCKYIENWYVNSQEQRDDLLRQRTS